MAMTAAWMYASCRVRSRSAARHLARQASGQAGITPPHADTHILRCPETLSARRCTPLAPDVTLPQLAQLSSGYTGADITAVCREAALAALEENLAAHEVAARHFAAALKAVPPSTPASGMMLHMYQQFQRSAR